MNRIKYNTERQKNEYFIDRYGKVHKFKGDLSEEICSIHYRLACQIQNIDPYSTDTRKPDDALMNQGWILVGSTVYGNPYSTREPSQAQINTLDRLDLLRLLEIETGGYHKNYLKMIK